MGIHAGDAAHNLAMPSLMCALVVKAKSNIYDTNPRSIRCERQLRQGCANPWPCVLKQYRSILGTHPGGSHRTNLLKSPSQHVAAKATVDGRVVGIMPVTLHCF